jgi:2-polyprenyl-3-methyl-5-hydroxy-6-metoxy-1,4-benzoquinol methylase
MSRFPKKIKDFSCSLEDFSLEYDAHYKLLSTTPFPLDIENYYPQEDYISHQNEAKGLVSSVYQIVKNYTSSRKIKLFQNLVNPSSAVLDYGAGNGFLVSKLKKQHWNAFGVEPSSYARKQAEQFNTKLYSSLEELGDQKFSAISLWHVLEHIPNYKEVLIQLTALLEEEGYLILALPNYNSWDASYYNSFWAAYDVPRHAYHFSKESIAILAEEFNLNLIKVKPMLFDSFYVSYLSEKNKGSKIPFIKGIFIGFLSNCVGFFKKEHSSHLYLLQKPKKAK